MQIGHSSMIWFREPINHKNMRTLQDRLEYVKRNPEEIETEELSVKQKMSYRSTKRIITLITVSVCTGIYLFVFLFTIIIFNVLDSGNLL